MSEIIIQQVVSPKQIKDFHTLPKIIYAQVKDWVEPLHKDIDHVFRRDKNPLLAQGEITRWNAYLEGNIVGRLAAFINPKYKNKGDEQATGGIGYFESINDRKVAHVLFDTARQWFSEKGIQAMDGPINMGERDKWWGLLVEGFHAPIYCLNYHLPYYQDLFTSYGFQPFYEQYCFGMHALDTLSDEHWKAYHHWNNSQHIATKYIEKNNLEKYAEDFATIYNAAWASHEGMKTLTPKRILAMLKQMKQIMIPSIIGFVYHDEQPIAMWVNVPDVNEYFKFLKGKWDTWAKLKMLFLIMFYKPKKFVGIVFGVVPEWQGKGIDKYMIVSISKINPNFPKYLGDYEIQWVGDFNTKMINVIHKLGATKKRTLITYRFLFDAQQTFKRHPIF